MIADDSALGGYRMIYDRFKMCQALVDSYELLTTIWNVYSHWDRNVQELQRFIFHPPSAEVKGKKKPSKAAVAYDDEWLTDEGLRSILNQHERGNYHDGVQAIRDALVAAYLHSPFENDRRVRRKIESETMQRIREGLAATDVAEFATRKITVWKSAPKTDEAVCRNLDMWCPALYINVECDEHDHKGYPEGYEEKRNKDITDVYSDQVVFYSFNPHAPDFRLDAEVAKIVQVFHATKAERAKHQQAWTKKIEDDQSKIAAVKAKEKSTKKSAKQPVNVSEQGDEEKRDSPGVAADNAASSEMKPKRGRPKKINLPESESESAQTKEATANKDQ